MTANEEYLLDLLGSLFKLGFIDITNDNEAHYVLIDLYEERKYFLHKAEEDEMRKHSYDMESDRYR